MNRTIVTNEQNMGEQKMPQVKTTKNSRAMDTGQERASSTAIARA